MKYEIPHPMKYVIPGDEFLGELIPRGMDARRTRRALVAMHSALSVVEPFDAESIERLLRPLAVDLGLKVGQLLGILRVAITNQRVSPPIFASAAALGRERTIVRLRWAIIKIEDSDWVEEV